MSDKTGSQKIIILNPDGTTKQLSADANGNLNVNVAAGSVTASVGAVTIKDPSTPANQIKVNVDGSINVAGQSGVTQIGDGTTITQKLAVDSNGKIGVNALPSVTIGADSVGLAKESGGNIAAIKADVDKIPAKGSSNMAGSTPVTIATDDLLSSSPKVLYDTTSSPYTTTASYADVTGGGGTIAAPGTRVCIQIQENNTNAVLCQILASNNNVDWITLNAADIAVAKNGFDYEEIATPWKYIKVQAKDAVGGTHGAVKTIITKG